MILVRILFMWFSHFYERITPPDRTPGPPIICKTFNIHRRKKKLYRIWFCIGTVLVIFSFFWTDNDLVCAPLPREWHVLYTSPFLRRHNYSHTFAHNSKTIHLIFVKLGNCYKQYDGHEFTINTTIKYCYFWSADPLN